MTRAVQDPPGDMSRRGPSWPSPGSTTLVMLGLSMGVVLMAIQLWLLTLAFNLFLLGDRKGTLVAAVVSGFVFLGGLAMLRVLRASAHRR